MILYLFYPSTVRGAAPRGCFLCLPHTNFTTKPAKFTKAAKTTDSVNRLFLTNQFLESFVSLVVNNSPIRLSRKSCAPVTFGNLPEYPRLLPATFSGLCNRQCRLHHSKRGFHYQQRKLHGLNWMAHEVQWTLHRSKGRFPESQWTANLSQ